MPRLRVPTTSPGDDLSPGEVVDATAEQAQQLLAEHRAELVREHPMERATGRWR